jgi:hypothetical protein
LSLTHFLHLPGHEAGIFMKWSITHQKVLGVAGVKTIFTLPSVPLSIPMSRNALSSSYLLLSPISPHFLWAGICRSVCTKDKCRGAGSRQIEP